MFVDLFGGGFNVGVNIKQADHIIYNDSQREVKEILSGVYTHPVEDCLQEIDSYIEKYHLSKINQEGYLQLREDYNNGEKSPMKLYALICYSFNYQIRFNSKGEYNMPFGKNRSSFNPILRQKFIDFVTALQKMEICFSSTDYKDVFNDLLCGLTYKDDFIYCDPPYYNSTATYNENGGWTKENEKTLLDYLDRWNYEGMKFALSNNLKYDNPFLDEWKNKYNIHYLDCDYSNCNYHKKDKNSNDIEVLITNY